MVVWQFTRVNWLVYGEKNPGKSNLSWENRIGFRFWFSRKSTGSSSSSSSNSSSSTSSIEGLGNVKDIQGQRMGLNSKIESVLETVMQTPIRLVV